MLHRVPLPGRCSIEATPARNDALIGAATLRKEDGSQVVDKMIAPGLTANVQKRVEIWCIR